jgi:hypothetical protein
MDKPAIEAVIAELIGKPGHTKVIWSFSTYGASQPDGLFEISISANFNLH